MNISFELVDYHNALHVQMYHSMMNKFRQDYHASGDIISQTSVTTTNLSQNKSSIYFVKVDTEYAGVNELSLIKHPHSQQIIAYVSEVIYIDDKFRNNDVATEVRKEMRTYKQLTENVDVIGTKVSIQRVKRKMRYFVNQQFKYMYNICDNFQTLECQTDDDRSLVLLTYDMLPAPYVALFPFKVRMSLAINSIDKYKTFYKKWGQKHSHKFSDTNSQEFHNYVAQVYLT